MRKVLVHMAMVALVIAATAAQAVALDPGVWTLPASAPGRVTGGGWIMVGGVPMAFGLEAEARDMNEDGVLELNGTFQWCGVTVGIPRTLAMLPSQNDGNLLHAGELVAMTVDPAGGQASMWFYGSINGVGRYLTRIDVWEPDRAAGSPGRFQVRIENGYEASGFLMGGDIRLQ